MDPAYLSALAALAGSTIGGLTSLAASWLSQSVQVRAARYQDDLHRRQGLYKTFIEEASKLYTDAWQSNEPQVSDLVQLYVLISRMRVLSSTPIVEAADAVGQKILQLYRSPNRKLLELEQLLEDQSMNPLREFSRACRAEFPPLGGRRLP
ncbi:MAG TPA: hypothetical protein VMS55_03360 [Myxococcota bacterium]|nr:hypothetical protein [Myxococcota bacterium]